MEMLGTRKTFDHGQISARIENENVGCPNKEVKRATISANTVLGGMLGEMLHRLTGA